MYLQHQLIVWGAVAFGYELQLVGEGNVATGAFYAPFKQNLLALYFKVRAIMIARIDVSLREQLGRKFELRIQYLLCHLQICTPDHRN